MFHNKLKILVLKGDEGAKYLKSLAKLRIDVFREFPYLYEGDFDYEEKYLTRYFDCPDSLLVVVLNEKEDVVGLSSCLPLKDEEEAFKKPFIENNYSPSEIFYFGESILKKQYRGLGIGKRFFELREGHAQKTLKKELRFTAFCAVERDSMFRPSDYQSPEPLWEKRNYKLHKNLVATYSWRDIGEKEETPKKLSFWLRCW